MTTEYLHRHTCKITGRGMSEGFLMNDETYGEQEDFVKVLRDAIPSFNADINIGMTEMYEGEDALADGLIPTAISDEDLLEFSYENEYHLWTDWYQEDLEEEGEAHDDDGNLHYFKDGKWSKYINLNDYEIVGGDGVENEVWEHKETKNLIEIPIEIVRDFKNVKEV